MLCPVCATEMNNSQKCPFCGHVCLPDEDNTVTLNGEVIRTGHRNHWCQTTDDKHLAGKMVDGTHYHGQDSYTGEPYATGQGVSFNGDLIPNNPNQGNPDQEITYTWSARSGMQMSGAGEELQRQKTYKTARWILILFLLFGWGLPIICILIDFIFTSLG